MYNIQDLLFVPSNFNITQTLRKKRPVTDVTGRFAGY